METAYVTSNGRLVVPLGLRKEYGIKPGTKICFFAKKVPDTFREVTA